MNQSLSDFNVVKFYTEAHKSALDSGANKMYPNLSMVRLESRYFGGKPGRLLDFGCGGGANLLHLLNRGHSVDACDTSPYSIEIVRNRLKEFPEIQDRASLHTLDPNSEKLPFEDEYFDYIVCASVLSLLSTKERIENVLKEFKRILKPGGKVFLDINGSNSEFAVFSEKIQEDLYIYRGRNKSNPPMNVICLDSKEKFKALVEPILTVDEVGITTHSFFEYIEEEYIICARK